MANGKRIKPGPGEKNTSPDLVDTELGKVDDIRLPKGLPKKLARLFKRKVLDLIQRKGMNRKQAVEETFKRFDSPRTPLQLPSVITDVHNLAKSSYQLREGDVAIRQEAQKRDLLDALHTGSMQPFAHYRNGDPWEKVEKDDNYQHLQKDWEILKESTVRKRILDLIVDKRTRHLRLVDLGPGTGRKTAKLVEKLIDNYKYFIDLKLVDVSPEMLFKTVAGIYDGVAEYIRGRQVRQVKQLGENRPWAEFYKFITEHGFKNTDHPTEAAAKKIKLFYDYLNNELERHDAGDIDELGVDVSLGRFFLAREFSLHKSDHADALNELDQEVGLPLEVDPIATIFNRIDGSLFHTKNEFTTLVIQLGNIICNQFPGNTLEHLFADNFLSEPVVLKNEKEEGEITEEDVQATYGLLSFHVGKVDPDHNSDEERQKEEDRILPSYNSPSSKHFVNHLFTDSDLATYIDPSDPNQKLAPEECFEINTTYEEDPDNKGFYGVVHKLIFKQDVTVKVDIKDTTLTQTESYRYKKKKGDEITLIPSYFPTIPQMEQLCKEQGLKVVEKFKDSDFYDYEDPTTALFLIRKMTKKELKERDEEKKKLEATKEVAEKVKKKAIKSLSGKRRKTTDGSAFKNHKMAAKKSPPPPRRKKGATNRYVRKKT